MHRWPVEEIEDFGAGQASQAPVGSWPPLPTAMPKAVGRPLGELVDRWIPWSCSGCATEKAEALPS